MPVAQAVSALVQIVTARVPAQVRPLAQRMLAEHDMPSVAVPTPRHSACDANSSAASSAAATPMPSGNVGF